MAISRFGTSSVAQGLPKYQKLWDGTTTLDPFESIATVTVGSGGQSQIDFTSIAQGYKHLQLRASYTCSSSPGTLRFAVGNGSIDTGANFTHHQISGSGGTPTAWNSISDTKSYIFLESQQSYHWGIIMDFLDYSNTTKNKTINSFNGFNNNGSGYVGYASTLWQQTSGITNIRIYTQSGNFEQYSKFALYGIRG